MLLNNNINNNKNLDVPNTGKCNFTLINFENGGTKIFSWVLQILNKKWIPIMFFLKV
jgi:hypothetical protein